LLLLFRCYDAIIQYYYIIIIVIIVSIIITRLWEIIQAIIQTITILSVSSSFGTDPQSGCIVLSSSVDSGLVLNAAAGMLLVVFLLVVLDLYEVEENSGHSVQQATISRYL
jgi:hypothetical protein